MPNSVILRPFTTPVVQRFYLECKDNNDVKSLGILKMTPVTPSFDRELAIVDDTRLESDKFDIPGSPNVYTKDWPSASELDTFLFARGNPNTPWRGARNPPGATSTPGLFAGYNYDTLGTRKGFENPALAVLLSSIGAYKSLVWMVDRQGASSSTPISINSPPMTALRAMSGPGRASTLAAYTQLGGRVWLMGGASAYASLISFDKPSNNIGQTTIFSNRPELNELGPGRVMWDGAHWQSTFALAVTPVQVGRRDYTIRLPAIGSLPVRDTTYIVAPEWRHYNRFEADATDLSRPDYSKLPLVLRSRREANDPVPPTRGNNPTEINRFYGSASVPVEYLIDVNAIIEDVDPDPAVAREISVLDTLYEASSTVLRTYPFPAPVMTYYHGNQSRQFVFTGLPPWFYSRQDCIALIDFVLQDIWKLTRENIDRGSFGPADIRSGGSSPARSVTPVKRTTKALVSTGTKRE